MRPKVLQKSHYGERPHFIPRELSVSLRLCVKIRTSQNPSLRKNPSPFAPHISLGSAASTSQGGDLKTVPLKVAGVYSIKNRPTNDAPNRPSC
jgi:hypothetical protein